MKSRRPGHLLAWTLLCSACGCQKPNEYAPPPPPEVGVQAAEKRDVTEYVEFIGRTQEVASAEIRARVRGFVTAIRFRDGQTVDAGDELYEIGREEYVARENAARAALVSSEAARDLADATLMRVKKAAETNAVSEIDVLINEAKLSEAKAAADVARAQLEDARIQLSYTKIASPIAGRISRTLFTEGNLVGQSEPTLLATVRQIDPMYVYFTVGERELLRHIRQRPETHKGRNLADTPEEERPRVVLQLSDGTDYPHEGIVDYIDNRVDPTAGTITVRARVPNPDKVLFSGMFVRVRIPEDKSGAILVPEVAVQRDLAGYFVMLVDENSTVQRASVTVGSKLGSSRVIEEGIDPSARVIVNGIQRARPGLRVTLEKPESRAEPGPAVPEPSPGETPPAGEGKG